MRDEPIRVERLDFSGIVFGSLVIALRNAAPFSVLAIAAFTPVLCGSAWVYSEMVVLSEPGMEAMFSARHDTWLNILQTPCQIALAAFVTPIVLGHLRERPVSLSECIRVVTPRLAELAVVAVLCTLAYTLGLVACVIPGIVLYTILFVAGPIVAAERRGMMGALERSGVLTQGHRLVLFGAMLVVGACQMILAIAVMVVPMFLGDGLSPRAELVVMTLFGIVGAAWWAAFQASAYHGLVRLRDGSPTEQVADVFA